MSIKPNFSEIFEPIMVNIRERNTRYNRIYGHNIKRLGSMVNYDDISKLNKLNENLILGDLTMSYMKSLEKTRNQQLMKRSLLLTRRALSP